MAVRWYFVEAYESAEKEKHSFLKKLARSWIV